MSTPELALSNRHGARPGLVVVWESGLRRPTSRGRLGSGYKRPTPTPRTPPRRVRKQPSRSRRETRCGGSYARRLGSSSLDSVDEYPRAWLLPGSYKVAENSGKPRMWTTFRAVMMCSSVHRTFRWLGSPESSMLAFNGQRQTKLRPHGSPWERRRRDSTGRSSDRSPTAKLISGASSEPVSVKREVKRRSAAPNARSEEACGTRRVASERSADWLARTAERRVGTLVDTGLPILDRSCASAASLLGALGVAFGMVPLFFGLAWNFGGLATSLAVYARYRHRQGGCRISTLATQTGLVLGVSAILLGCLDLTIILAGL